MIDAGCGFDSGSVLPTSSILHLASAFPRGIFRVDIDDDAKEIVRDIGTAINESVENSTKVAEAIERLRDAGYEMELTLRLEIGLRPHVGEGSGEDGDT